MESAIATLPKTKFWWRGMFNSAILRYATMMGLSCLVLTTAYWKMIFVPWMATSKATHDVRGWKEYQDFERRRALGQFRSCPPDGQERKYSW